MVTKAENEMLTRVGPGTPMGEMLREFWTPAIRTEALEAGGGDLVQDQHAEARHRGCGMKR